MQQQSGCSALLDAQQGDGGWGYRPGTTSWTEPTALSLLALNALDRASTAYPFAKERRIAAQRGLEWLLSTQRNDGGWPPTAQVSQSTWVTGLAVLALTRLRPVAACRPGVEWLVRQAGRPSSGLDTLRAWFLHQPRESSPPGWCWYPGTASWVIPTATGILALNNAAISESRIQERIRQGRAFLLARQCAAGGWNHGGSFVRSENAQPYPETTGIALLALAGTPAVQISRSFQTAEEMLRDPQSAEGYHWLNLALAAHNRLTSAPTRISRDWTTPALALDVIVRSGVNTFLS